eukprot:635417-Pelagomonas_calceolata.AAC.7
MDSAVWWSARMVRLCMPNLVRGQLPKQGFGSALKVSSAVTRSDVCMLCQPCGAASLCYVSSLCLLNDHMVERAHTHTHTYTHILKHNLCRRCEV